MQVFISPEKIPAFASYEDCSRLFNAAKQRMEYIEKLSKKAVVHLQKFDNQRIKAVNSLSKEENCSFSDALESIRHFENQWGLI